MTNGTACLPRRREKTVGQADAGLSTLTIGLVMQLKRARVAFELPTYCVGRAPAAEANR